MVIIIITYYYFICRMEFNEFCSPEHLGTHMDAPTHVSNTMTNWKVHEIPIERLIGDAVVINITARAMANPDSVLTVFDLEMWEAKHGQIPDGSIVLMYSGWDTYWGNKTAYFGNGDDDTSNFHFPGFSEEACKWLVKNRAISGIGVDTISIDTGSNLGLDVHRAVLSENIYGLENLMNLGRLPAAGARLYVFPMKIKGGSGAPTRVVAEFDPSDVKPVSKAGSFKLELVFICIMTILGLVTN